MEKTLKIGDKVIWWGGWGKDVPQETTIERIELTPSEGCKYGKSTSKATQKNYRRCVFDLINGHCCYGYQIDWEKSIKLNF